MFKRFPSALALLPLCALPCVAASHTHHAAGSAHASIRHTSVTHASLAGATRAHASYGHAAAAHAVSSHGTRGRYAEHAVAVHHEPTPSMEPARATEIQTALIHAGYLSGEPSGVWDAESIAAMQRLQDENGWQTKYTPDSRALVKLGLGGPPAQSARSAQAPEGLPATPPTQP